MSEDVWQEGLEELVRWNSRLRGVVEQVSEEGLEELVRWKPGLKGVVDEVPEQLEVEGEAARATRRDATETSGAQAKLMHRAGGRW